jgi:hypothetical protein
MAMMDDEASADDKSQKKNVINFELRRRQLLAGEVGPPAPEGIPDFIAQSDISKLSDDQLDQLINLIRLRRLNSTLQYERTMREKEQLTLSKAREQLEKKCVQVFKELDRSLTVLEKLELRINEMRGLRIQVGLDF